jgi:hypothetical protein
MKVSKLLILATAVSITGPAFASTLQVSFTGTVTNDPNISDGTTDNSGYTIGELISGSFLIDTTTDIVSSAKLGIYSAPPTSAGNPLGVGSISSTDAVFQQGLWSGAGDASNTSVTVDFSALSSFTATDPIAFLQSPAALAQSDFTGAQSSFPSFARYSVSDASGDNLLAVSAYLDSASVTPVPLPGALWVFGSGVAALLGAARRSKAKAVA